MLSGGLFGRRRSTADADTHKPSPIIEQDVSSCFVCSTEHDYINLFSMFDSNKFSEDEIVDSFIIPALLDSGSSFPAIPENFGQNIIESGVERLLSSLYGKNADGHVSKSIGKIGCRFKTGNINEMLNDTNSVYLSLELYGRNAFIILPIIPLTTQKFRYISTEESILGTYFVTPNSDWYKCYIKYNVPFIDLKLTIRRNSRQAKAYLEVSFARQPDFHLEFRESLSTLLYKSHSIVQHAQASNLSAVDNPSNISSIQHADDHSISSDPSVIPSINFLSEYHKDPFDDPQFIMNLDEDTKWETDSKASRDCPERRCIKPRFNNTSAQDTPLKQFLMFGCPGRRKLAKLHKCNIGVKQFSSKATISDKRYLVGHHPLCPVPHTSPNHREYEKYSCCTADFERRWSAPDIEGYTTSVLFMDIHTRYPFTVLLRSYSEFLDAYKKYEAFIWTNHQVRIKFFYGDSDRQWQATEEIKQAKTRTYQYMVKRGTKVSTSPPNTHQLNTHIENASGQCLHIMNRYLMIGCMSQKLRGRAWVYAVLIFSILPGPSGQDQFKDDENAFLLFYGYQFDASIIPGPLFCSIMIKTIGTKSGQAVRCSRQGLFIGLSTSSACIIGLELETKKTVRVYHYSADPDMSCRPALLAKSDELWNSAALDISPTFQVFHQGIRELFADKPAEDLPLQEVLLDPLTRVPVTMVPFSDENHCHYLLPMSRRDKKLISPPPDEPMPLPTSYRTTPQRQAARNANRRITDTYLHDIDDAEEDNDDDDDDDSGLRHDATPPVTTNETLKSLNRYAPVMKPLVPFTSFQKRLLRSAPLNTPLKFSQLNPKKKISRIRYEGYKSARDLSEFFEKGGQQGDLVNDMERGFVQIHAVTAMEAYPRHVQILLDTERTARFKADLIGLTDSQSPENCAFACHLNRSNVSGRRNLPADSSLQLPLREELTNTSHTSTSQHSRCQPNRRGHGCTLEEFSLFNFPGAPPSALYSGHGFQKLRTAISCNDNQFELKTRVEDNTSNLIIDHPLAVKDSSVPIDDESHHTSTTTTDPISRDTTGNEFIAHLSDTTSDGFVPMNALIQGMSALITDEFVDVFEHIKKIEGRENFVEKDFVHSIMVQLLTSETGHEIFECNAALVRDSKWPQTVVECFRDKTNWMTWKNALLHEFTKFMVLFDAADVVSQDEYHEFLKSADFKGLIPMRWVNVVKFQGNRHKSRLVVAQSRHRFDVDDHWSPTLSLETFRLLMCIATTFNARIEQADVLGAYLTVKLHPKEPPILVRMPGGLDHLGVEFTSDGIRWTDHEGNIHTKKTGDGKPPHCMRLKVAAYGLRKASQYFIYSFFEFLTDKDGLAYNQSTIDPCLFWHWDDQDNFIFVGIYSDNAIIVSKGRRLRAKFVKQFNTKYKESPDSDLTQSEKVEFLSLQITSKLENDIRTTALRSPKLMEALKNNLKDRSLFTADGKSKFLSTKVDCPLTKDQKEKLYEEASETNPIIEKEQFNCSETFGIILWITLAWRFDIMFESALFSRIIHLRHTANVCNGLKRLGWYLLDNDDPLVYSASLGADLEMAGFSDSSFCNGHDLETFYSILVRVCGATLIGRTKSIKSTMRCTRDSELYALMHMVMVIIGLRLMLSEMSLLKSGPTQIYCDNTAVLDGMVNKKVDRGQRYSAIRRSWIRDQVEDLLISLLHCNTKDLLADSGTKEHTAPSKTKFRKLLLGLACLSGQDFATVARHAAPNSKILGDETGIAEIHKAFINVASKLTYSPQDARSDGFSQSTEGKS